MDEKLLLNDAKTFLGLNSEFTFEELKENYHKLAKKYHPDSGEFTSDVLFLELNRHYENLKEFLRRSQNENSLLREEQQKSNPQQHKATKDPVFIEYKNAKTKETEAILEYYESRSTSPIQLSSDENIELLKLRKNLDPVLRTYTKILIEHPDSIWAKDIRDSILRLKVWWDH